MEKSELNKIIKVVHGVDENEIKAREGDMDGGQF